MIKFYAALLSIEKQGVAYMCHYIWHLWQLGASLLWNVEHLLSIVDSHMNLVSAGFASLTKLLSSGARMFQYEYFIAKKRSDQVPTL